MLKIRKFGKQLEKARKKAEKIYIEKQDILYVKIINKMKKLENGESDEK